MDERELEIKQFDLVYDYIKFHIGLYLATPPIIAVLADSLEVNTSISYLICFATMVGIFLISGIHAGLFMGRHVNLKWTLDTFPQNFTNEAYNRSRRIIHHWLYWAGLLVGCFGLLLAKLAAL